MAGWINVSVNGQASRDVETWISEGHPQPKSTPAQINPSPNQTQPKSAVCRISVMQRYVVRANSGIGSPAVGSGTRRLFRISRANSLTLTPKC